MTACFKHSLTLPDHPTNRVGGIFLPEGVQWIDRASFPEVASTLRITQAGGVHAYMRPILVGRRITLVVEYPYSWLYDGKYDALRGLTGFSATPIDFKWEALEPGQDPVIETHSVLFANDNGPALDFRRFAGERSRVPVNYDLWVGTIKLITV